MRPRFLLTVLVATAALIVSSCSSTTVVDQATRPDADPAPTAIPPTLVPQVESGVDADDSSTSDDSSTTDDDATAGNESANDESSADTGSDSTTGEPDAEDEDVDTSEGLGQGGAAQISSLIADCENDSDQACDILFQLTVFGSEEEAIALQCGGRRTNNDSVFCTGGINNVPDQLYFDDTSPALPQITSDCEAGDMTACDFLYFRSAVDSPFEDIGTGCAERTAIALPDCRTMFPDGG